MTSKRGLNHLINAAIAVVFRGLQKKSLTETCLYLEHFTKIFYIITSCLSLVAVRA